MPQHDVDDWNKLRPAGPVPVRAAAEARPPQSFAATASTLGVIVAGVALVEAALIPGVVIGGAAVLVPRYLPRLRRSLGPVLNAAVRRRMASGAPRQAGSQVGAPAAVRPQFAFKQAVAKTISFRIIVTSLDFTTNYLVLGELATAAGLSSFALVVGPLFYFAHETAWNYFGSTLTQQDGRWGAAIDIPVPVLSDLDAKLPAARRISFTINRALAKTITFRTVASAVDFTATYVVVGELGTAAALTAVGFVAGPFVYLGHELVWDHFGSSKGRGQDPLPAPTG